MPVNVLIIGTEDNPQIRSFIARNSAQSSSSSMVERILQFTEQDRIYYQTVDAALSDNTSDTPDIVVYPTQIQDHTHSASLMSPLMSRYPQAVVVMQQTSERYSAEVLAKEADRIFKIALVNKRMTESKEALAQTIPNLQDEGFKETFMTLFPKLQSVEKEPTAAANLYYQMLISINIYNNPQKNLKEKEQAMQSLLGFATALRKQKQISPFCYNLVGSMVTGMATGAVLGLIAGGVAALCAINPVVPVIIAAIAAALISQYIFNRCVRRTTPFSFFPPNSYNRALNNVGTETKSCIQALETQISTAAVLPAADHQDKRGEASIADVSMMSASCV